MDKKFENLKIIEKPVVDLSEYFLIIIRIDRKNKNVF